MDRPYSAPLPPSPEPDPVLERPHSAPLPPDGLHWYESPEWYEAVRVSGLLPELTEIAGRAWVLDTIRWARSQARPAPDHGENGSPGKVTGASPQKTP